MTVIRLLLQDGDTVTFINIHDLTRNFVLHCACPFQQDKELRSFDWWRAGRVKGSKYQKPERVVRVYTELL